MVQVIGALDGTYIAIVLHNNDGNANYFSRKRRYTISTQGFLGANLVFLDVQLGFQEAATMPIILEILTVHASRK